MNGSLIVKNGLVVDGTGNPPQKMDVAIQNGMIKAVGADLDFRAERVIDAEGLCVTPGFIDIHSHCDVDFMKTSENRDATNYARQGCATVVGGNCGDGICDIDDYFDSLAASGVGVNVAQLVPLGSVRERVMGDKESAPSSDELNRMKAIVQKGFDAGAVGVSCGLIYKPGLFATTEELIELAKVVAANDGVFASHIRNENEDVLNAVKEIVHISEQVRCKSQISHLKAMGPGAWGLAPEICAVIREARTRGARITADQYPYDASMTNFVSMIVPKWARNDYRSLLAEQDCHKLREGIEEQLKRRGGAERLTIADFPRKSDWQGKTVKDIATALGTHAFGACVEILKLGDPGVVSFCMDEKDVRYISKQDFVTTASDGRARFAGSLENDHPRAYGTFAKKIADFALNKGWLSLEQAIRSCAGLPADILGFRDRGYIAENQAADLNVIDLETLGSPADFINPRQFSKGFRWTLLAGEPVVIDDTYTHVRRGRVIRRGEFAKTKSIINLGK